MRTGQTQTLGAATLLVASLIVYGAALQGAHNPRAETSIPWGDQRPSTIALAVSGAQRPDGIYFFPASLSFTEILRLLGIDRSGNPSGGACDGDIACTVTVDGGSVNIARMPAVTHLALGLPIDLNRASPEDLSLVPGIDARLADLIVQRRQAQGRFESLSDLEVIRGIKERKVRALKGYLMVEPPRDISGGRRENPG